MSSEADRSTLAVSDLEVEWLGRVRYAEGLRLQEEAVAARRAKLSRDRLLLLEHPAVITLGRSSREQNLLIGREEFQKREIEVYEVARGGDVTYHAPGQLVGYLIVDLAERRQKDVHRFLRRIEGALIDGLASLGVDTMRVEGKTGVFVRRPSHEPGPQKKIASIGIGVRRWIAYHGFALNVSLDLAGFKTIIPCGLDGVEMTSVAAELGAETADLDQRVRMAITSSMRAEFRKP